MEAQAEGGGGVMKSSGPPVEEATASASQHGPAPYRWRHAGIRSARFQIRKWMFFKKISHIESRFCLMLPTD